MRRMNNLVTFFTAIFAFFFGAFISIIMLDVEPCKKTLFPSKIDQTHEIFLTILVISAPNNFERRAAIRETWATLGKTVFQPYFPEDRIYLPSYDDEGFLQPESLKEQNNRMVFLADWAESLRNSVGNKRHFRTKHLFAVGTKDLSSSVLSQIESEDSNHFDMLILPDLKDSYHNLTVKLLRSIEKINRKYSFSYLLKVDDDTYVKTEHLINELVSYDRKLTRKSKDFEGRQPTPELYWGYFNGKANVKTKGVWKERHFNLCGKYIPYALGGGYVLSRFLSEYIEKNAHLLTTYTSEDVSVGAWLAPLRNVYRRHDPRFDTEYMPRKCKEYHIVLHKRTSEQIRDIHEGKLCTFETKNEELTRRPAEHLYNWHSLADNCCDSVVSK